jgi:YD repeat-containing protein
MPLSYGADGNLTGFGSKTYTWNARNQLTGTSAGAAIFSYDALGRRIGSAVNGSTSSYLYDGSNPAMVSGNVLLAGQNLDEIYAQIGAGGTTSYLRDGLNSAVAETDATGTTTAGYVYSPYGDTTATGSSATPFQYADGDPISNQPSGLVHHIS